MKLKRIKLSYGKNKFEINLRVCGFFGKIFGLMFTPREKARALLFDFEKPVKTPIHSFFVFFDFLAIWINSDGKIIKIEKVKPFRFSVKPSEKFSRLIEIPLNRKYSRVIGSSVGDRKL